MTQILSQDTDPFQAAEAGLSDGEEQLQPKVASGFQDKKKVVILLVLLLVGGAVIAYQFTRGEGPALAAADTTAGPAAPAKTAEVESVLARIEAGSAATGDQELSVDRVEELVKRFDTYVRERQVGLNGLRVNPFAVVQTAGKPEEEAAKVKVAAGNATEQRSRRMHDALARLKVGSILLTGRGRVALIGGKLCRVGDVTEGFRVEAIEADGVTLSFDGQTTDLRLRPETGGVREN
jgi:hypothetical protein